MFTLKLECHETDLALSASPANGRCVFKAVFAIKTCLQAELLKQNVCLFVNTSYLKDNVY